MYGNEAQELTSDDRLMAILAHVLGMVISLASGTVLGFVAPLVIWLLKKDESPFVAQHAKEAMVFQIALIIIGFVLGALAFLITCLTAGLAFPLIILVALAMLALAIICPIMGALAANKGQDYSYPIVGNMF